MIHVLYQKDWIRDEWSTELYQAHKHENFTLLDQYLDKPPRTILDIGCGLAWESRMFNERYGTRLWLMDGDFEDNAQDRVLKQARYCPDAKDFAFYYRLDQLRLELDRLQTKNYQLIDCNSIDLDPDLKFDLITSWVSCGFHYPVSTYRDLIKKHSHNDTVIVMDLRVPSKSKQPIVESDVEILHVINRRAKYLTCRIGVK